MGVRLTLEKVMLEQDVRDLIASSMPSIWTLEVLLLMHRAPERAWDAADLNRDLRGSALIVANALGVLTAAGLVLEVAPGFYRYNPVRPELARTIERLVCAYAKTPFAVVQAILAAPNNQIRTFADAFRLKKD